MTDRYVCMSFNPDHDLDEIQEAFEAAGFDLGNTEPEVGEDGLEVYLTLEDADTLLAESPSMKSYFTYVGAGGGKLSATSLAKPKPPKADSGKGAPKDDSKTESEEEDGLVTLILSEAVVRSLQDSGTATALPDDAEVEQIDGHYHIKGLTREAAQGAFKSMGSPAGASIVAS